MELDTPEKEVEHDIAFDESGNVVLKKKVKVKRGRKSRSGGGVFELRVRKNLEAKGWIVDKWSNNLDLSSKDDPACPDTGIMHPAKRRFARFNANMGVMTIGTGFPDFVVFQRRGDLYKVIGVEVKMNGTLSKIEKEKCVWYLEHGIFSEILIASKEKIKNRVHVRYADVREALERMRK